MLHLDAAKPQSVPDMIVLTSLLCVLALSGTRAAECHGSVSPALRVSRREAGGFRSTHVWALRCPLPPLPASQPDPNAQPNLSPIYTDAPQFVRAVKNAKLYTVGEADDKLNVVHLYGKVLAAPNTPRCPALIWLTLGGVDQEPPTRWAMPTAPS